MKHATKAELTQAANTLLAPLIQEYKADINALQKEGVAIGHIIDKLLTRMQKVETDHWAKKKELSEMIAKFNQRLSILEKKVNGIEGAIRE